MCEASAAACSCLRGRCGWSVGHNRAPFTLRPSVFAVLYPNFFVPRKDFPGARTALSARPLDGDRDARTKLSALLGLRLELRCVLCGKTICGTWGLTYVTNSTNNPAILMLD